MGRAADLRVLWHLAFARIRGTTHAERLESFYSGQASHYDSFRARLLHGRHQLLRQIPREAGQVWVEMGGGTGANLEFMGDALREHAAIHLVDLAPSLLRLAEERVRARGWTNVHPVVGDACSYVPPGPVDVVLFSYSLTMIPDWVGALVHARELLKPGGRIAVVDFHVGRKYPSLRRRRQGWWGRWFWRVWFDRDNVWLSPDHLPALECLFETEFVAELRGEVPWLPLLRAPYYLFVGRKPLAPL